MTFLHLRKYFHNITIVVEPNQLGDFKTYTIASRATACVVENELGGSITKN